MQRLDQTLDQTTVMQLPAQVATPQYQRSEVSAGIVHIGVGNFHRAHQAVYCDELLSNGELNWGIHGISLRSPKTRDMLAPQDCLYTLAIQDDVSAYRIIGSLLSISVAPEDPLCCIGLLAATETAVITTTVTEKGYLLRGGSIDTENADFESDLQSLESPQSIYGYLAAAILQRAERNAGPVTILCCDNVHDGGALLRQGTTAILRARSRDYARWIGDNVSFASSVVDRVAPTTTDTLLNDVERSLGVHDNWPVATEAFSLWVIEDNFAGPRPPFDSVGAVFVDDVSSYERMKLAYLNAAHSIIAAVGFLLGEEFIHDALDNRDLADFVRTALSTEVLAATQMPADVDASSYIDSVLLRFRNTALPYSVDQVCSDSSQKIKQRWFPTIDRCIEQSVPSSCFAFALAAWVAYVGQAAAADALNDPRMDDLRVAFSKQRQGDELVAETLYIAGAAEHSFFKKKDFMNSVFSNFSVIRKSGVEAALHQQLTENRSGRRANA